jgi:predicted NBD/HSP70 family sugar kinase
VPDLLLAGLDIGGTKTLAVAVSVPPGPSGPARSAKSGEHSVVAVVASGPAVVEGSIVAAVRRATRYGRDAVLRSIAETLTELAEAAGVAVDGFAAVGVGVPGLVDREAGTVRHAVNLGLGDEPVALADHIADLARAPVVVDNDVNVAAVGAASALGCPGDLAYLSVGTGVAAGFVLGGRIRQGAHGAAGEIGHLPVDPGGPLCECGQRGCLEAVASGTAIAKRWPAAEGAASAASTLLAAAAAGDGVAAEVRDEVAGYLAGAVALIAQTVDPQIIVLGGGVAEAGPVLLDAVAAALRARAERSPMLAALDLAGRVALVPEGIPAGALGAALLARARVVADSVRIAAAGADDGVRGR